MLRTLTLFCCLVVITGCAPPGPDDAKSLPNRNGATKVSDLQMDGEYYIVKGADLHNVAPDLIGKKIRFSGRISDISHVPSDVVLILSDDECYFVQMPFGAMGKIPEDLKTQLNKFGLQRGNTLTIWATVDFIAPESGLTKSVLKYKSCIVKPVDKWER